MTAVRQFVADTRLFLAQLAVSPPMDVMTGSQRQRLASLMIRGAKLARAKRVAPATRPPARRPS